MINSLNPPPMKPPKPLRKKYNTDYPDRSDLASKARLLQSIWITEKRYAYKKYGIFLKLDFAKESGSNFLTPEIFELVKHEVDNIHINRKVIMEPRIWNNLLCIHPLAFNLFGFCKVRCYEALLSLCKRGDRMRIYRRVDMFFWTKVCIIKVFSKLN